MQPQRVRELMRSPAITASPTTSVYEMDRLMQIHQLRRLPIVDGTTLVGIVSRTDIHRAFPADASTQRADGWQAIRTAVHAEAIMTTAVVAVAADATIAEAAVLMLTQRVRSLPVIEREHVVGMITQSDLIRVLADAAVVDSEADRV